MKYFIFVILVLSCVGCTTPRGYSQWDKVLPAVDNIHGNTIDSVVSSVYSQFHYYPDLTYEWYIPSYEGRLGYRGDCEDFALLVASHLKVLGIPTQLLVLVRSSPNWKTNRVSIKRHAMLLLPDGRYVDNQHSVPFSDLGGYRVEWVSDTL